VSAGEAFLTTGPGIQHNDFMTQAWVRNPLTVVLSGIEGFRMAQRRSPGPAGLCQAQVLDKGHIVPRCRSARWGRAPSNRFL